MSLGENEILTPLGVHLSNLPVDVHLGKMILFGAIFRCLDPILTIAAALSFKSPFVRPFGKEDEADTARLRFRYGRLKIYNVANPQDTHNFIGNSDFLTIYKAYTIWRDELMNVRSKSGWRKKIHKFCKDNFLSEQNLEMIEDMKRQYLELLIDIGFVEKGSNKSSMSNRYQMDHSVKLCQVPEKYNDYSESIPVINAALTAGLYPKVAEYLRNTESIINKNMELQIHPSSVLFRQERSFNSNFMIYNTVVMNDNNTQTRDRVYMWEVSAIDPVALILFAGEFDVKVMIVICNLVFKENINIHIISTNKENLSLINGYISIVLQERQL